MKKLVTTLCTVAALAVVANAAFAANSVRISQVWSGGGSSTSTATYNVDYVELFNFSGAAVNVGGWTIEYGSATGNWGSSASNYFAFPAGISIAPCSYLLVQLGPAGTSGLALPVTPDLVTTNISAAQGSGKFGLFNTLQANVACGAEAAGSLVDKVAYGTANCAEGTAVATLTNTTAAVRQGGGTVDSDDNSADFVSPPPAVASVTIHNSASGQNVNCLVVPSMNSTWGHVKSIYR
jgi:hypothetical protein